MWIVSLTPCISNTGWKNLLLLLYMNVWGLSDEWLQPAVYSCRLHFNPVNWVVPHYDCPEHVPLFRCFDLFLHIEKLHLGQARLLPWHFKLACIFAQPVLHRHNVAGCLCLSQTPVLMIGFLALVWDEAVVIEARWGSKLPFTMLWIVRGEGLTFGGPVSSIVI